MYLRVHGEDEDDAQGVATGAAAGVVDGSSGAVQTVSARPVKVSQVKSAGAHAIDDDDEDLDLGEDDDDLDEETAPMKMKQVNKHQDGR